MATHKRKKDLDIGDKCRVRDHSIEKRIPVIGCVGIKNNTLCTIKRMCGTNARVKVGNGKNLFLVHTDYLRKVSE